MLRRRAIAITVLSIFKISTRPIRIRGMSWGLISGLLFSTILVAKDLPLEKLILPPGFNIEVYAEVENARQMAMGGPGILYVGSRRAGKVHAVIDRDQDGTADEVILIDEALNLPSGLAWHMGDLYVGAVSTIYRYPGIDSMLDNPPEPEIVTDKLPIERHHGWKYLAFGPDNLLYIPVGAPCNICLSEDPVYAAIHTMDVEQGIKSLKPYAHGVRNTVGFDWHPVTGELWFTDNGRDLLGDNSPPCELNNATRRGQHFGYPFIHGEAIYDPEFGEDKDASEYVAPALGLAPHSAPLGMVFYRGQQFPQHYFHHALIAEHGSWNRTPEAGHTGHRITAAVPKQGDKNVLEYEVFVEGWLQDNKAWGRPVDIIEETSGSILVSDDLAGVIYRISFSGEKHSAR